MANRRKRTPAEEAVYMDQTVAMTIEIIRRAHPDDDQLEEALNLLVRHVEKRAVARVRAIESGDYEFRLAPDRRLFAIYDPGNAPWYVTDAAGYGKWVESAQMDGMGWSRYLPLDTVVSRLLAVDTDQEA